MCAYAELPIKIFKNITWFKKNQIAKIGKKILEGWQFSVKCANPDPKYYEGK